MTDSRRIYSVSAECSMGGFLWVKSATDSCLLGSNAGSLMELASDQDLLSQPLWNQLRDWANTYMAGQPKDWTDPWILDFAQFNARGLDLTQRIHEDLNCAFTVQYVTSHIDPSGQKILRLYPAE